MTSRPTVYDLLQAKGTRTWVQLHVDTPAEAAAAAQAGIEIMSCEPDHNLEGIRREAPAAFLSAGMPHGSITSPQEALRAGFDMLERGADAIYCSHSPAMIEAMANEGIPVTGHIGLVPNLATWTNFRAIGRTPEEARRVIQAAKDIENAGAAFLEIEVVPVELARHISESTPMITMGMGCGNACDTQYLFSCDVLGTNTGHYPRHSKRYADLAKLEAELQTTRVDAIRAFIDDVTAGTYPTEGHEIHIGADDVDAFRQAIADDD